MAETTRLRNVGGGHRFPGGGENFLEGRTVAPGEVFEYEGDAEALCRTFPNKFERVIEEAPAEEREPPKTDGEGDDDTPPEGEREDVTGDFPDAKSNGLRVFRDSRGWWLRDDEEDVNDKPLRKKDVAGAIKDYLGE